MNRYILIVEDNATDEKLALRAFARQGLRDAIVVARDGAEALEYLFSSGRHADRDPPHLPVLMLLDLKLPLVDGLEVLRQVRADVRTRDLPVVILTASKEDEDIQRSYTLGANGYVRKAIDYQEFADSVQTIARFWLNLNEGAPSQRWTP